METDYEKRIGALERFSEDVKHEFKKLKEEKRRINGMCKQLLKENNQLRHENNMLINQLNFKTLDDDDMVLIKRLNNIYDTEGFEGVVDYAKGMITNGGVVKEKNGLIMMVTAGWSENEDFIYNLNHFMSKFHYHLVCTQPGGAFYYSPCKYDDIEIRRVTD